MTSAADMSLLALALDQASTVLGQVEDSRLSEPTPCTDWTVGDLVDHLVNAPAHFATIMRGEQPDWSAPPAHVGDDRVRRFRAAGDELLDAWRAARDGDPATSPAESSPLDWQLAELAVHTWDLAIALGEPTADLDPEVAERGLAFMRTGLTDGNRAPVFGPERQAPPDADSYMQIAAFSGRLV
jgi:uncharacterized protein (TIGR03086 family)